MSIACLFIRPRIERFVDEELSPSQRDRVRNHVAKCRECEHEVKLLITLRRAVRGIPVPNHDERFWDELWRSIQERSNEPKPRLLDFSEGFGRKGYRRLSLAAAVVGLLVLLVVGAVALWDQTSGPRQSVGPYVDYHVRDIDQHVLLQNHFWSNEYLPVSYNGR